MPTKSELQVSLAEAQAELRSLRLQVIETEQTATDAVVATEAELKSLRQRLRTMRDAISVLIAVNHPESVIGCAWWEAPQTVRELVWLERLATGMTDATGNRPEPVCREQDGGR